MHLPPLLQKIKCPSTKAGYILWVAGLFLALLLLLFLVSPSTNNAPQRIVLPPTEEETRKPALPAPPNTNNSKIILELFSPSDDSLTHQHTDTTYNQQIEQTLTITFILTKCQLLSQDDYSTVYRALLIYAQMVGLAPDAATADARVREIAESSSASYALVYSRTSCEDPQLKPLTKDVMGWVDHIFKQN